MNERYTPGRPIDLHTISSLQEIAVRDDVKLRPFDESDATRILEILAADPSIRDRVSVAAKMHTPEQIGEQVEEMRRDAHLIRYTLLERDNPIGLVSLWRDIDNPFDAPDSPDDYGFGYFLDPDARGKGLVGSAVDSIMEVASKSLAAKRFIAYCEDDNVDSIAVLTKLDFEPTNETFIEEKHGWKERKYVRANS